MRSATASAGRALGLLAAFVVVSVVAGTIAAGLFLPAVGASGIVTRSGVDWFNSLPSDVATPPLSEQSVMYASDGRTPIATFFDENRISVPLRAISPWMQRAIVAVEDSRFYQHGGIDTRGVFRAVINNALGKDIQGASTLTQQYIKNVNIETAVARGDQAAAQAAAAKNTSRKVQEMRQAIALEKRFTKDQILERYLNIANFGDNTYGVEAAARHFFNISAAKLNIQQSALLAGLVQLPQKYNPFTDPKAAVARRATVLHRMADQGYITQPEATTRLNAPLGVTRAGDRRSGCFYSNPGLQAGFFCDYVVNLLTKDPAYAFLGRTETDRIRSLRRGGLKIVTTLDVNKQKHAWNAVTDKVPVLDKSRVGAAAVTVQPGTGKVLTMAQNRNYGIVELPGQTSLNFAVDNDLGGSQGWQTGSTFKAFTLATWLKQGHQLNDTVDASDHTYQISDFKTCGGHIHSSETYPPHNSRDGEASGQMTALQALYDSVNTAFVNMEFRLNLCDIIDTAQSMGLHLALPEKRNGQFTTTLSTEIASTTLGPFEIAPLTMAAAYATFAADGTYCSPAPIASITARGRALRVPASKCSQALDPDVAHGVVYAMKRVLTQGTAASVTPKLDWPVAGKTGTTNDSLDSWFIGYTKQLATAVWVGNPTLYTARHNGRIVHVRHTMQGIRINGQSYGNVFGATIAGPIWAELMNSEMKGLSQEDWDDPPGSIIGVAPVIPPPTPGNGKNGNGKNGNGKNGKNGNGTGNGNRGNGTGTGTGGGGNGGGGGGGGNGGGGGGKGGKKPGATPAATTATTQATPKPTGH